MTLLLLAINLSIMIFLFLPGEIPIYSMNSEPVYGDNHSLPAPVYSDIFPLYKTGKYIYKPIFVLLQPLFQNVR